MIMSILFDQVFVSLVITISQKVTVLTMSAHVEPSALALLRNGTLPDSCKQFACLAAKLWRSF